MKFDEKLQKISPKSQMRMDRVSIILGISLLIASFCSFFVIEAFGEQDLIQLDCPKGAYHGLDNQGNEACRDIITNQILEPESVIIIDSDSEKTKSDSLIINHSDTGEITLNGEQPQIIEIIILALIGIIGGTVGVSAKKGKLKILQRQNWSIISISEKKEKLKILQRRGWSSIINLSAMKGRLKILQRRGWTSIQKEQVRNRQYDKCNMCFTQPSHWKYDYINGNKSDNELNNCQGLCPSCYSVKTEKIIKYSKNY